MTNEILLQIWAAVATVVAVFYYVEFWKIKATAAVLVEYLVKDLNHDMAKMSKITDVVNARRARGE